LKRIRISPLLLHRHRHSYRHLSRTDINCLTQ
jgi:hypothetical protein